MNLPPVIFYNLKFNKIERLANVVVQISRQTTLQKSSRRKFYLIQQRYFVSKACENFYIIKNAGFLSGFQ